ncbi:MAG: hypothetical protein KGH72_05060 [Candidatus Micrarchaeota archaeon]|nr:hypothetical protein [Candidatus Micrarchaeota archaeon]
MPDVPVEKYTLCYVCGNISKRTCHFCGRSVCNEHYDTVLGICTICRLGKRVPRQRVNSSV